jgi:hypothetical protein
MGDDFEYSSLMHIDAIKRIPDIKGRCLTNIAGTSNRTLETQIAFPYVDSEEVDVDSEKVEIAALAKSYSGLWSGKEMPKSIPLMPSTVLLPIDKLQRRIPVGRAKNLSVCSWNLDIANTFLVSYFYDNDAIGFVKYLVDAFSLLNFDIIVVDNQRNSLSSTKAIQNITYYKFNEQEELKSKLDDIASKGSSLSKDTLLVMFDFVRCLFPSGVEEKELIKTVDALVQDRAYKFYGVFADLKDFLNASRNSSTRVGQYLEGVNSGILIGNAPHNHTFGFSGLTGNEQIRPLDIGWGVNVSPSSLEIKRIKLAMEVEK